MEAHADTAGIEALRPGSRGFARFAAIGALLSVYLCYASLLYWTVPTSQGPLYDGPHRLPSFSPLALAVLVLVLALPVPLARRWPIAGFAAVLGETLLGVEFGARTWEIYAAALVAVCFLALVRSAWVSAVAAGLLVCVWILEQVLLPRDRSADLGIATSQMAVYAACSWGLGYGLHKRRAYAANLREQSAAHAVMAERLRIARELHDMVAHSIGIIAVLAGAAARVIETQPHAAREALANIETTGRETLTGLQRMVSALRLAEPHTGDGASLAPPASLADLDRLIARAADAGLRVDVAWTGERRQLPPEIDLSAFRVIQEAVTNVVRHSGTHACRISLAFSEHELSIEVLDNGRGGAHPAAGGGYGLLGMRERVAMLRGEFSAGPRPEGGFRVAASLPT